jgi:hypothetical protein
METSIDVSTLNAGIYIIRSGNDTTLRFVKE